MDSREAVSRTSRWTPSAVVFPPYHSGCFSYFGLMVTENGSAIPHFYLPPIFPPCVFEAKPCRGGAGLHLRGGVGQAADGQRKAKTMKEKAKKERVRHMFRKALTHQDIVTGTMEKLEYLLVNGGISTEFIPIKPRLQRSQVCRFDVSMDSDGNATLGIEEKDPFVVPPVLGWLALCLAAEEGEAGPNDENDPYVPYKSTGKIIAYMQASLERKYTKGALRQAIHRLRDILESCDCREVLQTNQRTGDYRIRLRRKKICALGCGLSTPGGGLVGSGQQSAAAGG